MASVDVLELLLTARYVGGPAFDAFKGDLESLSNAGNSLSKLGSAFSAVGTMMIAAGVGLAAGVGYAVKAASDYDSAIQRIVSVTPDLQKHTQALSELNQEIANAAVSWGMSPTDLAKGSYFLFSSLGALGATPEQLLSSNVINELAMYSRASGYPGEGGVSFSDAAQILPRLFTAGGLGMGQWGGAMGILTYLENNAHMTQDQLTQALSAYLPAMTALGMPFDQSATLLAAIASSGRVGAPAGRELMSAVTLMLSGSTQLKELSALGLSRSSFFKNGKLLPTDQIVAMLQGAIYSHAKSPADVLSIEHALFGQVGLRALGPLLNAGGYSRYQNLLAGERGAGITSSKTAELYMRAVAEQQMKAPSAQFDALKASLELLAIIIGNAVLPVVMRFVHWLTNVGLTLTKLVAAHPQLVRALAVGGIPALLGGGIGMKGMGAFLTYLGGPSGTKGLTRGADLAGHLGSMAKGLYSFGGSLIPSKADILSGLDAIGKAYYKTAEGIAKGVMAIGKGLSNAVWAGFTALHDIPNTLKVIGGAVKDLAVGGFGLLKAAIVEGIPALLEMGISFAAVLGPVLLIVGAIAVIVLLFTVFRKQGEQIASFFGSVFAPLFQVIGTAIGMAVQAIKNAWQSAYPAISQAMDALVSGIKEAAPLFQAIAIVIGGAVALVIATVVGLVNAFLSVLAPIIRIFGDIFRIIGGFFDLIIGLFTLNGDKIKQGFGDIFGGILDIIKQYLSMIVGFYLNFLGGFASFLYNLVNNITGGALKKLVDGFKNAFSGIGNAINNALTDIGNAVSNAWDSITGNTNTNMSQMEKEIADTYKQAGDAALKNVKTMNNNINAAMNQEASDMFWEGDAIIASLNDGTFLGMQNWQGNMTRNAKGVMRGVIESQKAVAGISSPSKVMFEIGVNLMQGLSNGILAGKSGVILAAIEAAQSAIDAANHRLKIKSPSQVFHEMGVMTMKGYQQGVSSHRMDWSGLMPSSIGSLHVGSIHMGTDANGPYRFARGIQAERERAFSQYQRDLDGLSYVYRIGYEYTA